MDDAVQLRKAWRLLALMYFVLTVRISNDCEALFGAVIRLPGVALLLLALLACLVLFHQERKEYAQMKRVVMACPEAWVILMKRVDEASMFFKEKM
eukprot:1156336-Pelagomonas_calceolata.AAC.5